MEEDKYSLAVLVNWTSRVIFYEWREADTWEAIKSAEIRASISMLLKVHWHKICPLSFPEMPKARATPDNWLRFKKEININHKSITRSFLSRQAFPVVLTTHGTSAARINKDWEQNALRHSLKLVHLYEIYCMIQCMCVTDISNIIPVKSCTLMTGDIMISKPRMSIKLTTKQAYVCATSRQNWQVECVRNSMTTRLWVTFHDIYTSVRPVW